MNPLIIAISGGSGSGKTTVAKIIAEEIGEDKVLLISMDRYYKDLSNLKPEERAKVDFDNPNAIDWFLFKKHIQTFLKNKKVKVPIYSFVTHTRTGYKLTEPRDVIIVEGVFALYNPEICKLMKMRVFVETPSDLRLVRRIQRDVLERKITIKSILEQWNNQVSPAHERFIEPTSKRAHIIIPEGPEGDMRAGAIKIIKNTIRGFYAERKVNIIYGEKGVKEVFYDILNEGKSNCVLDSEGQFTKQMPEFARWFKNQIEKKRIPIRHIVRQGKDISPSKTTQVRYANKKINSSAVINIYSNKVAIIIWNKIPEVVMIKDKSVSDSLRDYFELLWKSVKK